MSSVICHSAVSIDGYSAGPDQTFDDPIGTSGEDLHTWMFREGGPDPASARVLENMRRDVGAVIMGRRMFGPTPDHPDPDWRGWWGENPPYHCPTFVLTHTARDPIPMEGGTTFLFVTDGIASAFAQAREAAQGKRISIAGGASTVQQCIRAGLLDELTLSIVPRRLGGGERFLADIGDARFEQIEAEAGDGVTHIRYKILK